MGYVSYITRMIRDERDSRLQFKFMYKKFIRRSELVCALQRNLPLLLHSVNVPICSSFFFLYWHKDKIEIWKTPNPLFVFWQWSGSHGSLLFHFTGAPAITHFCPVIVTVLLSVLTVASVCDSLAISGACLVLKSMLGFVLVCVVIKVLFPCFSDSTSHFWSYCVWWWRKTKKIHLK